MTHNEFSHCQDIINTGDLSSANDVTIYGSHSSVTNIVRSDVIDNIVSSTWKNIKQFDPGKHVQTRAEKAAPKILIENKCVFVIGKSGAGKSRLALNVLGETVKLTGRVPVQLSSWQQWDLIPKSMTTIAEAENMSASKSDLQYVALVDDIFGSSKLVPSFLDQWLKHFDRMWPDIESGDVILVLTSRPEILHMCQQVLGKYKLMDMMQYINLDKGDYSLTKWEKEEILEKLCCEWLNIFEKRDIVGMDIDIGFPQCCHFFSVSDKAKRMGPKFFENPTMYILQEIDRLDEQDGLGYLVLLIVLMKDGRLRTDELGIRPKADFKNLVDDLRQGCQLSETPTMNQIKVKSNALCNVYLTETDDVFAFSHQSICDAVFLSLACKDQSICIDICTPLLLLNYVRHTSVENTETAIVLPKRLHGQMVDQITEGLLGDNYQLILDHPCLQDDVFVQFMVDQWEKQSVTNDIVAKIHQSTEVEVSCLIADTNMMCIQYRDKVLFSFQTLLANFIMKGFNFLVDILLARSTVSIPDDALPCAMFVEDNVLIRTLFDRGVLHSKESFRVLCNSSNIERDIAETLFASFKNDLTEIQDLYMLFSFSILKGNIHLSHLMISVLPPSEFWLSCYKKCIESFVWMLNPYMKESRSFAPDTIEAMLRLLLGTGCTSEKEHLIWLAAAHPHPTALKVLLKEETVCLEDMFDLIYTTGIAPSLRALNIAGEEGELDHLSKRIVSCSMNDLHTCRGNGNDCFLLHAGVVRGCYGLTCLHIAAIYSRVENVHFLLAAGARIDGQDDDGQTALHFSLQFSHIDVVRALLEHGASTQIQDELGNLPVSFIYGNSYPYRPFLGGTQHNIDVIKFLSDSGVNLNVTDCEGKSLLHRAAEFNDEETVAFLCARGMDVNAKDKHDNSVLHFATGRSKIDIMKCLCDQTTSVNDINDRGETILHLAASSDIDCKQKLVYLFDDARFHFDVNRKDNFGYTVLLHHVAWNADFDCVKYLCEEQGAAVSAVNRKGQTVLHLFKTLTSFQLMRYFLEEVGMPQGELSRPDYAGNTVLLMATRESNLDVVRYLCEKGAPVHVSNNDGDTVLHLAVMSGKHPVQKLIYFIDEKKVDMSVKNKGGQTAYERIKQLGHFSNWKEIIDVFRARGVTL